MNFEKEILGSIHNMEISIEKLIDHNLMKKTKLKAFKFFCKDNKNHKNKYDYESYYKNKYNNSNINQNFTYMNILRIGNQQIN